MTTGSCFQNAQFDWTHTVWKALHCRHSVVTTNSSCIQQGAISAFSTAAGEEEQGQLTIFIFPAVPAVCVHAVPAVFSSLSRAAPNTLKAREKNRQHGVLSLSVRLVLDLMFSHNELVLQKMVLQKQNLT